jgi:hypothetical protein
MQQNLTKFIKDFYLRTCGHIARLMRHRHCCKRAAHARAGKAISARAFASGKARDGAHTHAGGQMLYAATRAFICVQKEYIS